MIAQPVRPVDQPPQSAARDDVDVGRARQVAVAEGVQAVAGALHFGRILRQRRRQILRRSQVRIAILIQQPDPARLQRKELADQRQGRAQRRVQIDGAVERLGNVVENGEFAGGAIKGGHRI